VVVEKPTEKKPPTPEKPGPVEKVGMEPMEEVRGRLTCLTHVNNTQETERMGENLKAHQRPADGSSDLGLLSSIVTHSSQEIERLAKAAAAGEEEG
jgi:hypothetical protein